MIGPEQLKKRKTTSKRKKGNIFQDWCCAWLQKQGWQTHNQKTVSKQMMIKGRLIWISQRQDIFGCFDIIAIKKLKKPLLIQATMHSSISKRLNELEKIEAPLEHLDIQLWYKKKPGEVHIKSFNGKEFAELGRIIRGKFYRAGEENENSKRNSRP